MRSYEVLKRPVMTEKSDHLGALSKYVFRVGENANKMQVKQAVEKAFNVEVTAVNMVSVAERLGRYGKRRAASRPGFKKAIVTLKAGQTIKFFEGV